MDPLLKYHIDESNRRFDKLDRAVETGFEKVDQRLGRLEQTKIVASAAVKTVSSAVAFVVSLLSVLALDLVRFIIQ